MTSLTDLLLDASTVQTLSTNQQLKESADVETPIQFYISVSMVSINTLIDLD
jgi:hypothetical protein